MKNLKTIGFILAYLSYIPLGLWIVESSGFNNLYDTLGLSHAIIQYYVSENAFDLAFMGILTIVVFIMLLNRFKYVKDTHFRFNSMTKMVIIVTLAIGVVGMVIEVVLNHSTHSIHAYIGEYLKQLLFVALVEELIFRGYVFFSLLKLKSPKFKLVHVVLLSAFLFSIIHIPGYILYSDHYTVLSVFGRLLFPFVIGVLYASLFYINKDIISLVFIHATSNMISNYTGFSGVILLSIFWLGLIYYTYHSYHNHSAKTITQ